MTISKLPNAQVLVTEFLRGDPDVTAIFGDNIFTELPPTHTWPAARVTRVGGAADSYPVVLDQPLIQIDVWGGPKVLAESAAQTIRAVLATRLPGAHRTGIVYGVTLGSLRDLPDTTFDPARPRYILDISMTTRAPLA